MRRFYEALRRRNVIRVEAVYLAGAWLLIQIINNVGPPLHLPDWVASTAVILSAVGLPVAIALAWLFELTPDGLKPASRTPPGESLAPLTARKLDRLLILALAGLLVVFAIDRVVTLRRDRAAAGAVAAAAPATGPAPSGSRVATAPSIAVLPFVNMSSDREQEYFSDGLSEELLNQLAQLRELRVIGRTSSFAFKGRSEDLRAVGQALGVDHLLEGSVRKSGDRVRITAQLIKASDGSHLWSKTYERTLDDVFAIQEEIATTVADALRVTLSGKNPAGVGTSNVAAYDAYLAGRALLQQPSPDVVEAAVGKLRLATTLDPQFASAWYALGSAAGAGLVMRPERAGEWLELTQEVLGRLRVLPAGADHLRAFEALTSIGRKPFEQTLRDLVGAEEIPDPSVRYELQRARAQLLMGLGRPREALALWKRLSAAEPLDGLPSYMLQICHEILGDFAAADAEYRRMFPLLANRAVLEGTAMLRAMARRDDGELKRNLPRLISSDPGRSVVNETVQRLYDSPLQLRSELRRLAGDPALARDVFAQAALAQWAAYFGDPELSLEVWRGFAAREKAAPRGGGVTNILMSLWRPVQKDMRRLPAFRHLLQDLGVVDYWRASGDWGEFCRPRGQDFECR